MKRHPSKIFRSGDRVDVPISEEFQVCDLCERQQGDHRAPAPTPIATVEQCAAWCDYLKRWSLRYPCKISMSAKLDQISHLRIVITFHDEPDASDSENRIVIVSLTTGDLLAPSVLPDIDTPRWIRANIMYHLNHELDEHLKFDDKRPFDPHVTAIYYCDDCFHSVGKID